MKTLFGKITQHLRLTNKENAGNGLYENEDSPFALGCDLLIGDAITPRKHKIFKRVFKQEYLNILSVGFLKKFGKFLAVLRSGCVLLKLVNFSKNSRVPFVFFV